jgi:hypothetical protein
MGKQQNLKKKPHEFFLYYNTQVAWIALIDLMRLQWANSRI